MPEVNFNFVNLNQRFFVNLDQIYSVMYLGDADVIVSLIVSKRKKETCDRSDFTSKAGNKKKD